MQKRRSICFMLSDFLAPLPLDALSLVAKRQDLIGLCLHDRWEGAMPNVGLLPFYDLETGEEKIVDTAQKGLSEYINRVGEEHRDQCASLFKKLGSVFLSVGVEENYDSMLIHLFKQRRHH